MKLKTLEKELNICKQSKQQSLKHKFDELLKAQRSNADYIDLGYLMHGNLSKKYISNILFKRNDFVKGKL